MIGKSLNCIRCSGGRKVKPISVTPRIDNKIHPNLLTTYTPEEIPQAVIDALSVYGGEHGDEDSCGSGGGDHIGGGGH